MWLTNVENERFECARQRVRILPHRAHCASHRSFARWIEIYTNIDFQNRNLCTEIFTVKSLQTRKKIKGNAISLQAWPGSNNAREEGEIER